METLAIGAIAVLSIAQSPQDWGDSSPIWSQCPGVPKVGCCVGGSNAFSFVPGGTLHSCQDDGAGGVTLVTTSCDGGTCDWNRDTLSFGCNTADYYDQFSEAPEGPQFANRHYSLLPAWVPYFPQTSVVDGHTHPIVANVCAPCTDVPAVGCCSQTSLKRCTPSGAKSEACDVCGWNPATARYECGHYGADPAGVHPLGCNGCWPKCDGKTCGFDSCSTQCGPECEEGLACEQGQCVTPSDPCKGLAVGQGCCNGNQANQCETLPGGKKVLSVFDCPSGVTCSGFDASGAHGCADPPSPSLTVSCGFAPQPTCPEATGPAGCCDGGVFKFCLAGGAGFLHVNCAASGLSCGWNAKVGQYGCVGADAPPFDPAGTLKYCGGTWGPPCQPDCADKTCGSDGCGGSCGECPPATACDELLSGCTDVCDAVPQVGCCAGPAVRSCVLGDALEESCPAPKECGWDVTLGQYACTLLGESDPSGLHPKACPGTCEPSCKDKVCGGDGCPYGGECEPGCAGDQVCHELGVECLPTCDGATAKGCCEGETFHYCTGEETGKVSLECGGAGCGWNATLGQYGCGNAGLLDPSGKWPIDCGGAIKSCGDGQCEPTLFEDCLSCIDCACALGQVCGDDGACCTRECDGKTCGPDGCGGDCGSCAKLGPLAECVDGTCACTPDCAGAECGPDGCGTSCGACPDLFETDCIEGTCECVPRCDGRQCGEDGCLGSCGTCAPTHECDPATGKCECEPDCNGRQCGPDGCGGSCGICVPPAVCDDAFGQCDCEPQCGGKDICDFDGCGARCEPDKCCTKDPPEVPFVPVVGKTIDPYNVVAETLCFGVSLSAPNVDKTFGNTSAGLCTFGDATSEAVKASVTAFCMEAEGELTLEHGLQTEYERVCRTPPTAECDTGRACRTTTRLGSGKLSLGPNVNFGAKLGLGWLKGGQKCSMKAGGGFTPQIATTEKHGPLCECAESDVSTIRVVGTAEGKATCEILVFGTGVELGIQLEGCMNGGVDVPSKACESQVPGVVGGASLKLRPGAVQVGYAKWTPTFVAFNWGTGCGGATDL